jgi:hypothetical protein
MLQQQEQGTTTVNVADHIRVKPATLGRWAAELTSSKACPENGVSSPSLLRRTSTEPRCAAMQLATFDW